MTQFEAKDIKKKITNSLKYTSLLDRVVDTADYMSQLSGQSILITGATGMIGSCLIDEILRWNQHQSKPCHVYALSRSSVRAKYRFGDIHSDITFIEGDITRSVFSFPDSVDYIIHAASNADPVKMASSPVDTLLANVEGVRTLVEYGIGHGMKRFLYISSGEMYGQPNDNYDDFVEGYCGPVDHSSPRACYPVGKRAAEVLCQSYISEYGVDAVIVRPCHVFGATMTMNDSRAVSEFFRNAFAGKDIVLKSAGMVERSHCNVIDVASAILCVLLRASCGEAYNIADKKYQMTIRAFAEEVSRVSGVDVKYEKPSDTEARGYSKVKRAVLSAEKLEALGWKSVYTDVSAIEDTYLILKEMD